MYLRSDVWQICENPLFNSLAWGSLRLDAINTFTRNVVPILCSRGRGVVFTSSGVTLGLRLLEWCYHMLLPHACLM